MARPRNFDAFTVGGRAARRTYDAENRMLQETLPNSVIAGGYTYDAEGRRVKRETGGAEVWHVYGMGGEMLAEYAAQAAPTAPHKEYASRHGELLVTATASTRVNVALAAQGGRASASSTYNSSYPVTAINDGERTGTGWGVGGGWNDATTDRFPDWVAVTFTGPQTIDEIDVVTLQDHYAAAVEPSAEMQFTQYGVTAFEVEYWNGAGWVGVEGGQITGNRQVWRRVQFAAVTTDKIRVVVKGGLAGYSRVVEVAAWRAGGGGGIECVVSDQLGTPRMVVDETGSLSGVKRHDYLPFGEELFAGTGGRTITQGYSQFDAVRQKFTSKERDDETGLDYFLARYYSSTQGRFTSPDEFTGGPDELYSFVDDASANPTFYADLSNPQSLNKYQYAYNNPLRYIDPDGHEPDHPDPQIPIPVPVLPPPPAVPVPGNQAPPSPVGILEKLDDKLLAPWREKGPILLIRQALGTSPEPTVDAPSMPQTGTSPSGQTQPLPPPPPLQAKRDSTRTATRTIGGVTPGKTVSDKQAQERLRRGGDVMAPSRAKAKELQKKASGGAVHDNPHRRGYRPHFHGKNRKGGHAFY